MTEVASTAGAVGPWQSATVEEIRRETRNAKTFRLRLERPAVHDAGQHFIVRLTAPDGYTASRSYSVASPPVDGRFIELTIERLANGEVSGFLHDEVVVGDELEVRGPIGRWFVWNGAAPALLVGGGSGVVPLMAMLRLSRNGGLNNPVRLIVSVRTPDELYYSREIEGPDSSVIFTRIAPAGSPRPPGHLSATDLPSEILPGTVGYVCGSSGFADHAAGLLVDLGIGVDMVRIERFGPTS